MPQVTSIIGQRCATLNEIQEQVKIIAKEFNPLKIILFGSYAWGKPTLESDVDLLIVVDSEKPTWQLASEISIALDYAFPLDLLVKTKQDVEKRLKMGDYFIEDIMKKGQVLYERAG
ncbi:nucleotidyltransferase domain-containing protein [candidate division KSB1 bacterium]|nr:MAG: nucleotidyltransferase domain-containing protein [candidate division KSB1 bacterium]